MTDLRTAAQQALEALEQDNPAGRTATITALRAALEQQAWVCPESPEHRYAKPGHCEDCGRTLVRAQQAEPVEPVAWMYTGIKQDGTEHGPHLVWKPAYMDAMSASKGAKATPLYTAPPQRKPLTVEEIPALAEQVLKLSVYYDVWALLGTDGLVALVRAVEAKHNIKE